MTRTDRPEGRPASVGTHRQATTPQGYSPEPVRGSVVQLDADAAFTAVEIFERCGPDYTAHLVACLHTLWQIAQEVAP